MQYIHRNLEDFFKKSGMHYPAILLTGPRQVGKTTFLRHVSEESRNYVSLDIPRDRNLAKEDPELFLERHKPPVLIDEIQYAPELLPFIKVLIDKEQKPGMFWLTGSQQYKMMERVRETLAGRIGILELYSLSAREKAGLVFDTDLDFSLATLQARQKKLPKKLPRTLLLQQLSTERATKYQYPIQ